MNINRDELYKDEYNILHVESGIKFKNINDIPEELKDDDLYTLNSRIISKDERWRKVKTKISWIN